MKGYNKYDHEAKLTCYQPPSSPQLHTYSTDHTVVTPSSQSAFKEKTQHITKGATQLSTQPVVEKPFKCTVPGCSKSYKNLNGLKYHNEHGHRSGLLDIDEKRPVLKPYKCEFPDCDKRYKNPNGLKYHLEHAHQSFVRRD
ncbi:154_t:CDS:1 [Paraglomus brasilianum]|uniref:154_t:CDS:1 n=1 Tax=Paraglomus brasilianum TaxID=144538 RepID=A0A9N9D7A4_9GLOM|nr:154_t:CDS:1 [Paraglomus brasilianum]